MAHAQFLFMDTISRENTSYLPLAGVVVGVLALVLAAIALAKASSASKTANEHAAQVAKIETIENELRTATAGSEKAGRDITALRNSMQGAFDQVALELGNVKGELAKIQEAAKAPRAAAAAAASKSAGPVVAGPDEYIVKSNDSGAKIARSHGVSLADLMAVNPGVNWNRIKPGDKLKLPKK